MANILIIEDDAGIRTVLSRALQAKGHDVLRSDKLRDGLNRIQREKPDVVVSDVMLPDGNALDYLAGVKKQFGIPVVVISARNNVLTAIRAGKAGAFEYLPKPFDMDMLIDVVDRALAQGQGRQLEDPDNEEVLPIVGRSNNMQEIFRMLGKVIQTDLSVMITGESGTGKELIARTLHDHGSRADKPFIAVNMAAIPADLIETELFGYEKGAFTGADHQQAGKFEQAQGGTLFLDEIGDMPETAQTRLLRVLQEGEFTRVGGSNNVNANVRIVAATHRNMEDLIREGRFREDLFYRLNVVPVFLPPLRARVDDIADLVHHFIRTGVKKGLPDKVFHRDAIDVMRLHQWPGNIRELENLVHRLMVLKADDVINADHVNKELPHLGNREQTEGSDLASKKLLNIEQFVRGYTDMLPSLDEETNLHTRLMREFERPIIQLVLDHTKGNQLAASRILGINRNTLRKKIQELDISTKGDQP